LTMAQQFAPPERDSSMSNHHCAPVYCLSIISMQTRSAFVARENRCLLFRIMLQHFGSGNACDSLPQGGSR